MPVFSSSVSLLPLYVLYYRTAPCKALPTFPHGSPGLSFGWQQREIRFPVYTEDRIERKREKWDPKQYMAPAPSSLWCAANIRVHFTSSSVGCYGVQGWSWMRPSCHCLWKLCVWLPAGLISGAVVLMKLVKSSTELQAEWISRAMNLF